MGSVLQKLKKVSDTPILSKIGSDYFLDSNLVLKSYSGILPPMGMGQVYDDIEYNIYDYGSITLFLNKKTGRTCGYPISNASQVFKVKNEFYISINYKEYSAFYKLKSPDSLFDFKGIGSSTETWTIKRKNNSWDEPKPLKTITQVLIPDTTFRYYNFLVTFPYKNRFYTILTTDSLTLLALHENERLKIIDTVIKGPTYGTPHTIYSRDVVYNLNSYGLFVIKGNQITLVKFE